MKFLLVTDGIPGSKAALGLGGELARLAHAQVTVLETGADQGEAADRRRQEMRERLGSGLAALETRSTPEPAALAVAREADRQPCDLVVLTPPPREGLETAERVLRAGHHHLLIVPEGYSGQAGQAPTRVLICVAVGEPGKEDVSFAGRLARHLGAEATILTVMPEGERRTEKGSSPSSAESHAERFLAGSTRTLWRLGVTASTRIRYGNVRDEILAELAEGKHDLLVLGTPLPGRDGALSLGGLVEKLLPLLSTLPVLIVRSKEVAS